MQKNVAGQKIGGELVSATNGSAFTGTVTVYVTGDAGTQAIGSVGSGICTYEGNGYHTYAPAQAETNYDLVAFTFIGTGAVPATVQVYTRFDANAIQLAGVTQSLTDLKDFADDGYDPSTNKVQGVALTDTVTTYTGNTLQTGDSFARIGATGSGLTSLAPSATALSTAQWTNARAGYLDNLNVGGAVASQADINALNQSASRRVILTTVGQYERPESGSTVYTVEARTYSGDGAPMDATGTPTLTATGQTSGDLSANLSAATNPATGVYRWAYTVAAAAMLEPVRMDFSATVDGDSVPMSVYTQIADFVAATFTTADRTKLDAVYNKLPTNNIGDQTLLNSAIAGVQSDTDDIQTRLPAALTADGNIKSDALKINGAAPNNLAAGAQMDLVNTPNATAVSAIQSGLATDASLATLAGKFTGITFLADWLRRMARGDAGTAGMIAAEAEIDTGGTSTFDGWTDNLEVIYAASSGGGGPVEVGSLTQAALAQFVTDDTGETTAVAGSVAELAQGAAGSGLVTDFTDEALAEIRAVMQGAVIIVRGPVSQDGEEPAILTLVIGDDYLEADGRAIEFDLDGPTLPDLTDATIVLRLQPSPKDTMVEIGGEATVPTGATKTIRFEPTSAETILLAVSSARKGDGIYEVHITDAAGHEMTPLEIRGELIMVDQLS